MKFQKITFILFFIPFISFTQNIEPGGITARTQTALYDIFEKSRNPDAIENDKILGSQYYQVYFSYGKIFLKGKELENDYTFRYNAYSDEIEVNNGSDLTFLLKDTNISCEIGEDRYSYQKYIKKNSDDIQFGYLKTIFGGKKVSLYLKEIKKFKEGKKAKNSLTTAVPPKLIDFEVFYFSKTGETPHKIKLKNKDLLKMISSTHKSEMEAYIKENKINIKNRVDLIAFFKFYDSLLSTNNSNI